MAGWGSWRGGGNWGSGGGGNPGSSGQGDGGGWGNAAHSQGTGKGPRSVEHSRPLCMGHAQTVTERMRGAESFLFSGAATMSPSQLVLQIADGDRNGNATWMDAPNGLQLAVRDSIANGEKSLTYQHTWHGGTTNYEISFWTMTSTNPDSKTVRAIRVIAAIMWP